MPGARLVSGELVADAQGNVFRLPGTLEARAEPLPALRDVVALSRRGARYCALHGARTATCFTLEPGAPPTAVVTVPAPVQAVIGDMALRPDGSLWRDLELVSRDVAAAAVSGKRSCIATKRGVACQTDDGKLTPVDERTGVGAVWLTSNAGFASAGGRVLATWAASPDVPAPQLELTGAGYTSAASGFRLACLGRAGREALCWDMLQGSASAPAPDLVDLQIVRGAGHAVCGLNGARELLCAGELRRTSRSVTSLRSMLRGVAVARDVVSFDLTEGVLAVVTADGSLVVYVEGEC
jgi:hypothetical protein